VLSSTTGDAAGTVLALGIVVASCTGAVAGTIALTMTVHRRLSRRVPDIVEATLLLVVGSVILFGGGWLFWLIYWLGVRRLRLMRLLTPSDTPA
jgi:Mn2+/Fe2+ NRAMP family transporter